MNRAFALVAALWFAAALGLVALPARAQRRTPATPPPAALSVTPLEGYRVRVSVEAREALELVADRRLLRVEIRDARNRRASCVSARPRSESRVRALAAGEAWTEWLDLRELCWGRGLAALEGAREVSFHFDAGRARGAWVVRTPRASFRALAPIVSSFRPPPSPAVPAGAVTISLAPVDAVRGGRPTLRVRIAAGPGGPVRAFVRPEHVAFRIATPSGGRIECTLPPFAGRALPDFFVRLAGPRVVAFALDAVEYCGRLEEPGIYEVTPILTLPDDGAEWRLAAATGTFVGAAAPLRVRSATYVEQPVGESP
jgi:hypothetical protein